MVHVVLIRSETTKEGESVRRFDLQLLRDHQRNLRPQLDSDTSHHRTKPSARDDA